MKNITISTDFFNRNEIQAIGAEFGPLAELFALRLLLEVHKNDYFIEWNRMTRQRLLRAIPGLSEQQAEAIVKRLAEYGFFDRKTYQSSGVLTSAEIQQAYFKGHAKGTDTPRYLLVQLEPRKAKAAKSKEAKADTTSDTDKAAGSRSSLPENRPHVSDRSDVDQRTFSSIQRRALTNASIQGVTSSLAWVDG